MQRRVGVLVGAGVAAIVGASLWLVQAPRARAKTEASTDTSAGGAGRIDAPAGTIRPALAPSAIGGGNVADVRDARRAAPITAADAASDALDVVRAAIAARTSPSSTDVLMRALDGDDPVAKLEAIDELARRKHVPALGRLMKIDPSDDPFVGPTALLALGQLAHDARDARTEAAVARLEQLLAAEKERRGTDSPGNILLDFEPLGLTKAPSAARILERELGAPEHGTAAKVAIVDAIEVCGQRSSVQALTAHRAAMPVNEVSAADDFERQLELELVAALDRAIGTLSR